MTSTLDAGQAAATQSAAGPQPAPETTPQTPALAPSISQAISNAVRPVSELKQDPGTAVAVGAAGGSPVKAQAVAQAGKRQANATAQDQVKPTGTSIFGDIAQVGESALSKVAHYANDGLATVQHEYRYLHDQLGGTFSRHDSGGRWQGVGILAGCRGGDCGTRPGRRNGPRRRGGSTGIEGVRLTYKDSWQRTLNPNYRDPHTGQLVSFGRDIASAAGLHGGEQTAVSGALDGLGDMIADPLGLVGKGLGEAHSVEGMGGALGKIYQGTSITAENVDQAWATLPSFRRAMSDIASRDVAGVRRAYPQFTGIANELGAAKSAGGGEGHLQGTRRVLRDARRPEAPHAGREPHGLPPAA